MKTTHAFYHLNPLDYRDNNGSCRFCGQPKITARHNCDNLRRIADDMVNSKKAKQKRHFGGFTDDGDVGRNLDEELDYIRSGKEKSNFGC